MEEGVGEGLLGDLLINKEFLFSIFFSFFLSFFLHSNHFERTSFDVAELFGVFSVFLCNNFAQLKKPKEENCSFVSL